ncbi:MAG: 4Fe-4S binding protein, partial [Enterococcus sp.]|nr:4Fe-4S binding protein [Enterococcus sp.]
DKIISITENLTKPKVIKFDDSCIRERSCFSHCSKCIDICPVKSLSYEDNTLQINQEACIECGACTSICPSQALVLESYKPKDIVHNILDNANSDTANITCEYLYYLKNLENTEIALVNCLSVLDESILLYLFNHGIKHIKLYAGACKKCPAGKTSCVISIIIESAKNFLSENYSIELLDYSEDNNYDFPVMQDTNTGQDSELSARGESKRNAFLGFKNTAKEGAIVASKSVLMPDAESAKKSSSFPCDNVLEASRHKNVLDFALILKTKNVEDDYIVDSRLFADLTCDFNSCNGCNLCYSLCPTKALRLVDQDEDFQCLEFSPQLCIDCRLCTDVCKPGSVSLKNQILLKELLSGENKKIKIPTYLFSTRKMN